MIFIIKIIFSIFNNDILYRLNSASIDYYNNSLWWKGITMKSSNIPLLSKTLYDYNDFTDNIACFRVPSIIGNKQGFILSFSEARIGKCDDCTTSGIVMKKSYNNGLNWTSLEWIIKPSINIHIANPTSLYDNNTNRFILHYLNGTTNDKCNVKYNNIYQIILNGSSNILSKSHKLQISEKIYPGPGNGLVFLYKSRPRYIFTGHYLTSYRKKGGVYSYYSDDFGYSYTLSNKLDKMDEASIIHLPNNTLEMNMRNNHNINKCKCRAISRSTNGGEIWKNIKFIPILKDSVCEASTTRIDNHVFFLNPHMYYSRSNLTLFIRQVDNNNWKSLQITDEMIFTDYTGILNYYIINNNRRHIGIIWGSCYNPLPWGLWCFGDSSWNIIYSLVDIEDYI